MPYTFAATGDDITQSSIANWNTGRTALVCGWFRPTTLTATRVLFSSNALHRVEVDTTTSELRMVVANATTPAQYTSTGAGFVVNEWRFLAYLQANGTATDARRLWTGTVETAPQECTTAVAVAGVGNIGGAAGFTIGNLSAAGAVAYQGDIANFTMLVDNSAAGATSHPFGLAALGAVSNEEALHIYETLVLPLWRGDTSVLTTRVLNNNAVPRYHFGLDVGAYDPVAGLVGTVGGAVWSQNGAPRPIIGVPAARSRRR